MPQENPCEDVVTRIQQVTRELKTIQEEVFAQLFPPEGAANKTIFLESPSSTETVMRLKAGIDSLRHTLWLYIDATVKQREIESDRQSRLLLYATEMLRALSQSAPVPHESSLNSTSFVSHLLNMVNSYMENQAPETSEETARVTSSAAPQELRSDIAEQKTVSSGEPLAIMIA